MNNNEKCHKVRQISFVFSCVQVVPTGTATIKAYTPSSHSKRFPIFISLSFSLSLPIISRGLGSKIVFAGCEKTSVEGLIENLTDSLQFHHREIFPVTI